jgi:hypothetical protein
MLYWRTLAVVLAAAFATRLCAAAPVYTEASVGALMPGGSRDFDRSALWSLRAGVSVSDWWNAEAEFGEGRVNAASARALWRPIGYEQFDPFVSVGAAGFGNSSWCAGPEFGIGFFWYLGDRLSLRADFRSAIALEGAVGPVSSVLVGIGWTF